MSVHARHLVFGLDGDGLVWPETAAGGAAVLGHDVIGPAGLLDALETALALRRPGQSPVRRISAMRTKLNAVVGKRFWTRSLAVDSWATARLVLGWRDSLIAAGWRPTAQSARPGRLGDLAAAEAAGPPLPPGHADRLAAVTEALAHPRRLPWASLTLLQSRELLPTGLRRLMDRLAASGVRIDEACVPGSTAGDLGRVQRLLVGAGVESLQGDGSFVILTADTEIMAADALASWLAAGTTKQGEGTVCVLGAGTGVLDAALVRLHQPRFGFLPASPARAVLQVLSLAFATRWAPFNPYRLLDLLHLPDGPVPRMVAWRLAKALVEAPGRDNPSWTAALDAATTRRHNHFVAKGLCGRELKRTLDQDRAWWRDWAEGTLFEPVSGMPASEAQRICSRVAQWALRDAENDPLRVMLAAAATDLAAAIGAGGELLLSRHLLTRMVDEAIGPGLADPQSIAQAATWSAVHAPGAVWGPADTVIWWAPGHSGLPAPQPWTVSERAELEQAGCAPVAAVNEVAAAAHGWRQPLLMARERMIMVLTRQVTGAVCPEHPLMHELHAVLQRAPPGVLVRAESLLAGDVALAGRMLRRVAPPLAMLSSPRRAWTVRPGVIRPPERISATAIEQVLGCRFAWTLDHVAHLRGSAQAAIPDGERLLGLLAHSIICDVFRPGPVPDPFLLRRRAEAVLQRVIEAEATPLLLPGAASDLARARVAIPRAVEALARAIVEAGLEVVGTEIGQERHEPSLAGAKLHGRLDLLLQDGNDRQIVLDLKWTGHDKYRRAEVSEGRPVQLATYARLSEGKGPVTAGYFMLAQAQLLAVDAWPFAGDHVRGTDLGDTWHEVAVGWAANVQALKEGRLEAAGVGELDGDPTPGLVLNRVQFETRGPARPQPKRIALPEGPGIKERRYEFQTGRGLEPPCRFCSFGRICGMRVMC